MLDMGRRFSGRRSGLNKKDFFIEWFKLNGRDFPWRSEDISPYKFLVTEMLLRQTRAGAVAKLWEAFMQKYPDAWSLARADKKDLIDQIGILGFGNQRAVALLDAAQWLVNYHNGQVPETLEELLEVPHIGNYSARAILCFAFGHSVEIVDVNILRFFARYYGLEVKQDIRRNPKVWELAREALPRGGKRVQQHNYGMLDFTADVCKSGKPRCEICPLSSSCKWGIIQLNDLKEIAR